MSPHLGQGINLALLDAWQLARSLERSVCPRTAFAHYARARRVSLDYYATITYLLSPFFQSDWSVLGWGRDWVLPILPHLPWVRQQMGWTVCGLKGGYLRGEMRI
jgi:2-polyprenyl-6-methoxyphenol hydroxylase-like FAD-dependent oxidoreductase